MSHHPRWVPPPPLDASWAEQRHYENEKRQALNGIKVVWVEFFSKLHVVTGLDVPAGLLAWEEPPEVGPITLGPPTRFSIKMRPGQMRDDFRALAPRLASAFEVDDVAVAALASGGWLTILLVEHADPPAVVPLPLGEPGGGPGGLPTSSDRGVRPHRNPLGRRRWRGPFGRPRSWG